MTTSNDNFSRHVQAHETAGLTDTGPLNLLAHTAAMPTTSSRVRRHARALSGVMLVLIASSMYGCKDESMTVTESNKAFITQMLGEKKRLEDFPERVDPDLLMHEPASLPFGGTYRGLADFQRFYPKVRRYYDFETFELLGVYADGDTVFATIRVGIAGTQSVMFLAEQFTFAGTRLTEVRVHICDAAPSGKADQP
jgi:hypothetical protein